MHKQIFLAELRSRLAGLPQEDVEERLGFYSEMIDDRMEEGLTEEEAVSRAGNVDDIAAQIISEIPLTRIVKEKIKPARRIKAWEIVLLVLGSPIWIALLGAAFAIMLSLYVVVWSLIISLWAVFASLAVSAVAAVAAGIFFIPGGKILQGIALIGAGTICAGLAIFLFFGCRGASKGLLVFTKSIVNGIKNSFVRKEAA